jgi:hypothetical protein
MTNFSAPLRTSIDGSGDEIFFLPGQYMHPPAKIQGISLRFFVVGADCILALCDDLLMSDVKSDQFSLGKTENNISTLNQQGKSLFLLYICSLCICSDMLRTNNLVADLFRKNGRSLSISSRVPQSDPKGIWSAPDIFSFPVARPKYSIYPARSNTVFGAPSLSLILRGRSGHAGHSDKRGGEWRAQRVIDTEV